MLARIWSKELEFSYIADTAILENYLSISYKFKYLLTLRFRNCTPGYFPKINKNKSP